MFSVSKKCYRLDISQPSPAWEEWQPELPTNYVVWGGLVYNENIDRLYFLSGNYEITNMETMRYYVHVHDMDYKNRWRLSGLYQTWHIWKFGSSVASDGWRIYIFNAQQRHHQNGQWGVSELNYLMWMDVRTERWGYRSTSYGKPMQSPSSRSCLDWD